MTIISYITKIYKNTQMTFREQDTNAKAVFTTDTKLPHQEIGQFYKSRTKFSTQFNSLMDGRIRIQNQIPHLKTVRNLNLWSTDMAINTFLPYLPKSMRYLLTTK